MKRLLEAMGEEILAAVESAPWPEPEGRPLLRVPHLSFEGVALMAGGPPGDGPRILLASLELREPAQVVFVGPHALNWRCRDRLDDPRCIERMAENVAVMADTFHGRQIRDAEAIDDAVALQATVALKAFLLGFDALRAGDGAATAARADEYLDILEANPPEDRTIIIGKAFYALLAATCRPGDRETERRAAELGRGFIRLGGFSPLLPWKRIVAAVRSASGSPVSPSASCDDVAAERLRQVARATSRLDAARLVALDYYLKYVTLDDIARQHALMR